MSVWERALTHEKSDRPTLVRRVAEDGSIIYDASDFMAKQEILKVGADLGLPAYDMGLMELLRHHKDTIDKELIRRRLTK